MKANLRERMKGCLIEIDGIDGSGKETQVTRLRDNLLSVGLDVLHLHFPRYGKPSARKVEKYLNGEFGELDTLDPREVSKWYAEDRHGAAPQIREALDSDQVVICDRYVSANMAHQGGKFDTLKERLKFFRWELNYEYGTLGLPRPDLTILLAAPFEVILERLADRKETKKKKDLHEDDLEHIRRALETYRLMPLVFEVPMIECGRMSREEVEELIWMTIEQEL